MGVHRGDHSRPGRERASSGGRALNALVTATAPALDAELKPPTTLLADDPVPAEVAYQLVHDELADLLLHDLRACVEQLTGQSGEGLPQSGRPASTTEPAFLRPGCRPMDRISPTPVT